MSTVTHYAGQVGALSRSRPDNDPELIEARHNLRAEKLAQHITRVVEEAPPLTPAQIDRLAALLRPTSSGRGDAS